MFNQFQVRYPTSSLISELITIASGKYVVRASVQIEGVTRATGLAAADTIEQAEDTARSRALEVLLIGNSTPTLGSVEYAPPSTQEALRQPLTYPVSESAFSTSSFDPAARARISSDTSWLEDTFDAPPELTVPPPPSADWKPNVILENTAAGEVATVEEKNEPTISSSRKVTSINSRRHDGASSAVKPLQAEAEINNSFDSLSQTTEPVDLSDELARIKSELKRLGWSDDLTNKFLERTYNKKSLSLLDKQETLEFLQYLESFAKIDVAINRIGWSQEKGKAYLLQTYGKGSRSQLTPKQLGEFLQHLELQPDPIS